MRSALISVVQVGIHMRDQNGVESVGVPIHIFQPDNLEQHWQVLLVATSNAREIRRSTVEEMRG